MLRLIYRLLWWLVAPCAVVRLWWRSRREHGYIEHVAERFGRSAGRPADDRAEWIWVHAVSVGETRAAEPLIEALLEARPGVRILLTHMTPSGRATGEQLFGARVARCYLPYDMPFAVRRFLAAWRPALGVVMETEVWPTLIDECARAGVPLVLANARMSARSHRRAARFGRAARPVFGGFTRVLAQSPADAERLAALGARNPVVLGNLKFDITAPAELVSLGHAWRAGFGGRLAWVAASTRDGEEMHLLEAFRRLHAGVKGGLQGDPKGGVQGDVKDDALDRHAARRAGGADDGTMRAMGGQATSETDSRGDRPTDYGMGSDAGRDSVSDSSGLGGSGGENALLFLVPRHPQRFDEIAALLERSGISYARRSSWVEDERGVPQLPPRIEVVLGDSMGEMAAYYAAADLAFIGGSLLPLGGQNLIEACAIGTPVLVGPHTFNFTQATADALAAGAALRVADATELADQVRELLHDRARRTAMSGAAAAFAARHRGATARTVDVLVALLPR